MPDAAALDPRLAPLSAAIAARPAVTAVLDGHCDEAGLWSLCFALDPADPEVWEEVGRFAWLFNNLYRAVADGVTFRPVVVEDRGDAARRLCWLLEALDPDYTPERAVDVLLTPLPPFAPPMGGQA